MATKSDLEKMATKSDLEKMATKSDLEKMATKSDLEKMAKDLVKLTAVSENMQSTLTGLKLNFGVRSEELTGAWMARHISATRSIQLKSDAFKSVVIKAPKGEFLFFKKDGKGVNSIELDCYSVEPVHAVGEFKAIMKPTDFKSKDSLLEKVDLFVRKVKYLKDKEGSLPLAFFCVAELDFDLVDEIVDILNEVHDLLVANIHKRDPFVAT